MPAPLNSSVPLVPRRLDDFNEVDDDDDFEIKIRYDKGALGRRGRLLGSNIEGSLDVRIVCDGATTPSQPPSADDEKKDDHVHLLMRTPWFILHIVTCLMIITGNGRLLGWW